MALKSPKKLKKPKHDSYSVCCFVQVGRDMGEQAKNGFLKFKSGLVGKLEWVHQWVDHSLELVQDESLQGLLDSSHICELFFAIPKG